MIYNKKVLFWAACSGLFLFGVCMIVLGSVASDLRAKLQINELAFGTLFSILPLGIIAGSFIFGPIADRYGYKTAACRISTVSLCGF